MRRVRLAGRHAAVVSAGDRGGERLAIHDLRRGRRVGAARTPGSFSQVRLDRGGLAAFLGRSRAGTVVVGSTSDGAHDWGADIDPSVLGLAASSVAYRTGDTFQLAAVAEESARDGTLLRAGGVRLLVRDGRLIARGRRPVRVGAPVTPCLSSSGCSGVDALQVQGRFLAVRDRHYAASLSGGQIRVYDLRGARRRTVCRSPGVGGSVGSFVLTGTGSLACAMTDDHSTSATNRIVSEGTVLDQGPGVDLDSLTRRDDRLVWLHDGAERTAPLP